MSERRRLQSPIDHIHLHVVRLWEIYKIEDLYADPEWHDLVRCVNNMNDFMSNENRRKAQKQE